MKSQMETLTEAARLLPGLSEAAAATLREVTTRVILALRDAPDSKVVLIMEDRGAMQVVSVSADTETAILMVRSAAFLCENRNGAVGH